MPIVLPHRQAPQGSMTLADFAHLIGAPTRWCQNALHALGPGAPYSWALARTLGLARLLHQHHGMPLRQAMAVAARALEGSPPTVVRMSDPDGVTALEVDVPRYLTQFSLRAARLQADTPRRRGRPRRRSGGGIAAGEEYGLDLSALRGGLRLSPAERLRQLDANQRLIAALRGGRRSR